MNPIHASAPDNAQKSSKNILEIDWDRAIPRVSEKIITTIETNALLQAGYTKDEAASKMTGERMFALSISWFICPPAIIVPIVYSLYKVNSQPSDSMPYNYTKSMVVSHIINKTVGALKK